MRDGDRFLKKLMMTRATHPDVLFVETGCDCARNYRITRRSNVEIEIEVVKNNNTKLSASNKMRPIRRELVRREWMDLDDRDSDSVSFTSSA